RMKIATRTLVLVGIIAWVALIVATFIEGAYSALWWSALASFFVAWVLTRIISRDLAEKRSADLDEYEATLRNRARNIGYWTAILGGAALLIITSIFAGQARDGDTSLLLHAPALILALILAASASPAGVPAWDTPPRTADASHTLPSPLRSTEARKSPAQAQLCLPSYGVPSPVY